MTRCLRFYSPTISQRLQIAAFSLSEYESHRETQDVVAAARREYLSVTVRNDVARSLVQTGIESYVKEYPAYLYSQSYFPKIDFVGEYLLKVFIFEMFELLLVQ